MKRVGVLGLAITGRAVARALAARGIAVVLADDRVSAEHRALAAEVGAELHDSSSPAGPEAFLDGVDTLLPAPGVPPLHPVIVRALAEGIPVRTEIDVAYEWEQSRPGGPRPVLGVTGTDGKTTTTMVTAHLLRSTGRDVAEVGNTDLPFMAALDGPHDAFVVECSSFRLQFTDHFRCDASVWLNLAPDHLDWHGDLASYTAAKARLWAHVRTDDVVVAPEGDTVIVESARRSAGRLVTFGLEKGDYRVESGNLVGPRGPIAPVADMWRAMPHDLTNSLAAAALVIESGMVPTGSLAGPLGDFVPAHHRIEHVGTHAGSEWYDDSKATSPHAALTAIRAFDRLVLIAGGRNKDLDLSQMAGEPHRMEGVVAIGDDAPAIEAAFAGVCPVVRANDMASAVAAAASMARPGVAVLLSPGCTSYDWYRNYNERGEDFVRHGRQHFGGA